MWDAPSARRHRRRHVPDVRKTILHSRTTLWRHFDRLTPSRYVARHPFSPCQHRIFSNNQTASPCQSPPRSSSAQLTPRCQYLPYGNILPATRFHAISVHPSSLIHSCTNARPPIRASATVGGMNNLWGVLALENNHLCTHNYLTCIKYTPETDACMQAGRQAGVHTTELNSKGDHMFGRVVGLGCNTRT